MQTIDFDMLQRGTATGRHNLSAERWTGGAFVEQDVALEPPRGDLCHLVACEHWSGDVEDVVEFFQRQLLGLGSAVGHGIRHGTYLSEDQEQHDKGDRVQTSVEAERAGRAESTQQTREGQGEN